MKDTDYAWAAGFFDGEGSFIASPGPSTKTGIRRRYFRLSVAQKNPELLHKFQNIFGCGRVGRYTHGDSWMHSYVASGKDALGITSLLWRWLGEQKKGDFKRKLTIIRESRALASEYVVPPRRCADPGCNREFVPDVRHPGKRLCSKRCYERLYKRKLRGSAPERFCNGCGCHVNLRTRGCRRCMTRHWERKRRLRAKEVV